MQLSRFSDAFWETRALLWASRRVPTLPSQEEGAILIHSSLTQDQDSGGAHRLLSQGAQAEWTDKCVPAKDALQTDELGWQAQMGTQGATRGSGESWILAQGTLYSTSPEES